MIELSLLPIPNQRFSITLDGAFHEIDIKALDNGALTVSIWRDGVAVIQSVRALPNRALIPYDYLEHGNFVFTTTGNDYPDWRNFGAACRLIYVTPEELAVIRNG